jgi:hypothetical protein
LVLIGCGLGVGTPVSAERATISAGLAKISAGLRTGSTYL